MYSAGNGVPQSHAEALGWLRLAAEQGDASGQFNLALMYARGSGVPKNYMEAYKWLTLAAAQGDAKAAEGRDLLRAEMTPAFIAEAERLAAEWKPKK
jgi:TPR repeat protein